MHDFEMLEVTEPRIGIHWFGQSSFALKDHYGTIVQLDPYFPCVRPDTDDDGVLHRLALKRSLKRMHQRQAQVVKGHFVDGELWHDESLPTLEFEGAGAGIVFGGGGVVGDAIAACEGPPQRLAHHLAPAPCAGVVAVPKFLHLAWEFQSNGR